MDRNQEIKTVIEEIISRMNIRVQVEETDLMGSPCFQLKTLDGGMLIGENGQNLFAIYSIVRRIMEHRHPEDTTPFLIDINDYQRKRIEEIKERARMSAQRVRYFKKEVVMQPMSAYERRIIHMALAEDPDVKTESVGEGETRRIVIKPAETQ